MAYSLKLSEHAEVCVTLHNNNWAAMKKVPNEYITKEQLEREYNMCLNVNHDNVIKLLDIPYLNDKKWHIPLEFIFGENLDTTMFEVHKSKIKLTTSVKATIITGICEALFYLHSNNIVHQDLKPDNIMVEHGTHRAVIVDMRLAKFCINGMSSAPNSGNLEYSAPEILQLDGVRDKRSDVWAMGKIIAELWAKVRLPTDSVSDTTVMEILRGNPYCNPVAKMVITSPRYRATMEGVIDEIRQAADPGAWRSAATAFFSSFVTQMSTQFAGMSIPSGQLQNGTMVRSHYDARSGKMECKMAEIRDGNVVWCEDIEFFPNQ